MIRSAYTAALSAAFGALMIGSFRDAVNDQLWQPAEAIAVGLTALAAGAVALFGMAMRAPKDRAAPYTLMLHGQAAEPGRCLTVPYESSVAFAEALHPECRDDPQRGRLGKRPLRDRDGRFVKAGGGPVA